MTIKVKRVDGPRAQQDGHRVLVHRLWLRCLSKTAADIDLCMGTHGHRRRATLNRIASSNLRAIESARRP